MKFRSLTLFLVLTFAISAFAAVSVSVAPGTAAVAVNGTLQFVPTVSGTTTTTVTWSVDGISGGNATVGTITAGGLYTAPAAAGTHSIKATSTADSTQSATAQTTVFDSVSVDFGSRTNTSQPIPANWFGAQLSTFQDWASVGMVAQAGITGTRLYANLDTVYATQTPDWTKIDPIIQHLKNAGIRPILQIAYTPPWLQPSPNPCQGLTNLYKAPPTDVNAWANIAASYVSHMNATFPGFITDYEIWNEPDNQALLCVADNTDATRRTTYFNIYAAAGPAMRAAAGSTPIRIGGPALSTPDQHWSTWIQPFVTNSNLAPYIDFVSYHHYFGYKNNLTFDSGADTLYSRTQGSYRGVISIYNRIANIVKAGSQPNAASTPIYVDEYNTTSDPTVDCCRSSSTYSPVWNALLVADLLNTAYQGAPHLPAWINYYSVSNPSSQACLFGVINANMDCAYPTSGAPSPYPQHYAYKLLMTPNYLGLGSGGYAAASVSPPATQRGIVVAGFYSANRDGVLLVNPTSTDYSALTVNFDNPGYPSVGATGYLLNNTNQNITTQALSVSSTASGFAASVSLPPYSVLAISLVQQSGPPPVGVSISPTTASVATGATQQFQATVSGATDTSVVWSVDGVNGGNTTVGTVSTSGLYTAPSTTGNHTVTAISNADSTKSASAAVTVTGSTSGVSVSISPTTASVAPGASQQFQATVTGTTNTSVIWSVDGVNGGNTTVGTVNTSGLYTAPTTTGNHTVTATSNADSTKSASSQVTVTSIRIAISPTAVTLPLNGTKQFAAIVTGTNNKGVKWFVDGVRGGTTASGIITNAGKYTAPNAAGNHTVTITSNADPTQSASAAVTVSNSTAVSISVSPQSASLATSATQQFQATVTGTTNTAVTWSVDGATGGNTTVGTVSSTGLYTAPTTTGNHTVTATSNADTTKSASAAVTVTSSTQTVAVSISPTTASVATNATQQFQATVTGTTNTSVAWSVDGVTGGNTTVGTVSTTGLYTAPSTTGNHTVTATSNADSTKSASAAVTVTSGTQTVAVSISPTTASVATSATQQFQATVTGTTNTAVTWSVDGVNGGNTTIGTVSAAGLYTAPTTTGSHTVTATSNADSTKSASATVTVTSASGVTIAISPTSVSVPVGTNKQFAATVTGTTNTGVKWYVDDVLGGTTSSGTITTAGLYTAPSATGNHVVKITSNADPTKSATSQVTVTVITIAISPTAVTIPLSGTKQFAATVTGTTNTGVKWYVDGVLGGNTTSGLITTAGNYTAPSSAGSHTVTITSNADPTKSASSAVTVSNSTAVSISVSPTTASIATGATQLFQASVTGTTNTAVTWSVDGVTGGNATVGTVSTSGLYTAPGTTGNHTVTATSNADTTKSASAAVTVTGSTQTVTVSISPTTASMATGATQQFQATVTGAADTSVTWSVDGVNGGNTTVGTVSTAGLYTAPDTSGSHTVTATSNADTTKSASAAVTVTDASAIAVNVTPSVVGVTFTQPQQFVATLTNTTNTAVTWQVDGVTGGNTTVGTVDSSGLYTPPQSTGPHNVVATSVADPTKSGTAQVIVTNHPGVFTYYMDNNRTGANTKEIILTPSNVNSTQFGKLFAYNVDGNVFAEPLYVPNLQVPGVGFRNVVFVATEHDSVYAFDADGRQTAPYWQTSFINPAAGITTIPATDLPTVLVGTEIGITSTPAIDAATNTIYVIGATKENGSYFHRLHALDITTGAEKFSGPTTIQASVPGTGDGSVDGTLAFNPLMHLQRGAVTLSNGIIYATWASHADTPPYHGWIMAFDATHLNLLAAFSSTPNSGYGGIWQAGCGPAADSSGNVYFATGNATFNANTGGTEYGDTVIRAHVTSAGFAIDDYFTPTNQSTLETQDLDLGSTCTLLVPVTQAGSHPNILMAGGKQNRVYVLDRDNLGRFNSTSDANAIQVFSVTASTSKLLSHGAYWNGNVYFQPNGDALKAYTLQNGLVSSSPTSIASFTIGFPGSSPVVSANGTTNALVWLFQRGNGVLHAFDATNVANKLFSSPTSGTQVKFAIPTVVNGKVYVGTNNQLVVFGLLGK